MGFCNFTDTYGTLPQDCTGMANYLWQLTQLLVDANPIKCDEAAVDPEPADLNALWGACDVPAGAIVYWYNTGSATGSTWAFDGTLWTEME